MAKEDRDDLLEALADFVKQYEVIDGLMTASDYCVYYTPLTGWTADLAECAPVLPFVTAENCGIKSREDAERALLPYTGPHLPQGWWRPLVPPAATMRGKEKSAVGTRPALRCE